MYKKELYVALSPLDTINFIDSTLWRYDGLKWYNIAGTGKVAAIYDMCVYNDDLYIGGYLKKVGNDSVNGIVALHMNEPTGCNWLIPRVYTNSDTFYLGTGQANVQFYNNNAYANSWQWNFGDAGTDVIKDPLHIYNASGTYTASVTVTHNGCTKTAQKIIKILNGNGIEEYTKENLNFKLYPNPTTGDITVEVTLPKGKTGEIQTFSSYGSLQEKITVESGTNKIKISADKWSSGVALCCLFIDGKQVLVEKVVKQ